VDMTLQSIQGFLILSAVSCTRPGTDLAAKEPRVLITPIKPDTEVSAWPNTRLGSADNERVLWSMKWPENFIDVLNLAEITQRGTSSMRSISDRAKLAFSRSLICIVIWALTFRATSSWDLPSSLASVDL